MKLTASRLAEAMAYNSRRGLPASRDYARVIWAFQSALGLDQDGKHGADTEAVIAHRAKMLPLQPPDVDPLAGWVWPMPILDGHEPAVSSTYSKDGSGPNTSRRNHWGVDIMYRRHVGDGGPKRPQHPTYTRGWYCPHGVEALAVGPGSVAAVAAGWVLLDHHDVPGLGPLATWYQHLHEPLVEVGDEVAAGQPIGIVGLTGTDIRHLHFEWRDHSRGRGRRAGVVDPEPYLARLAHG